MFEKPQNAEVVRIKIEAVSLHATSIAPSLDGPPLADSGPIQATTSDPAEDGAPRAALALALR